MAAPTLLEISLTKSRRAASPTSSPDGLRLATQIRGMEPAVKSVLVCGVSTKQSSGYIAYELALGMIQMNCAPVMMLDLAGMDGEQLSPIVAAEDDAGVWHLHFRPEDEPSISETPSTPMTVVRLERGTDDPISYLSSPEFASFLRSARDRFGFVVLNAPCVPDSVASLVSAPLCDAVVVSVGARKTKRAEVQLALTQLRGVKAHVIGFVFDESPRRQS